MRVRAKVEPGQSIVVQESWDPAWQAWDGGKQLPLRKDVMGFMVVDAPPGDREIRLAFVTPLENRVGRVVTLATLAAAPRPGGVQRALGAVRVKLSRRREILLDCFLLFVCTAVLVGPYFKAKYTDKWSSIESTFISDARFLAAHWPHPQWQPLWYTGTRFDYIYPPALRYGTAAISKVTGFWPVKAYHFYTIFFYCVGIAGVYLLIRAGIPLARRGLAGRGGHGAHVAFVFVHEEHADGLRAAAAGQAGCVDQIWRGPAHDGAGPDPLRTGLHLARPGETPPRLGGARRHLLRGRGFQQLLWRHRPDHVLRHRAVELLGHAPGPSHGASGHCHSRAGLRVDRVLAGAFLLPDYSPQHAVRFRTPDGMVLLGSRWWWPRHSHSPPTGWRAAGRSGPGRFSWRAVPSSSRSTCWAITISISALPASRGGWYRNWIWPSSSGLWR